MHGAFFPQIRLRNYFYSAFEIYVYNLSVVNSFTVHELDKNFPHSYRKLIHVKAAYSVYFRCIETFCYARQIKTGRLRSITYTYSKPSINFLNLQLNANHFLFPSTCVFTPVTYIRRCVMLYYIFIFLATFQLATIQT